MSLLKVNARGGLIILSNLVVIIDIESEARRGQDIHPGSHSELRTESGTESSKLAVLLLICLQSSICGQSWGWKWSWEWGVGGDWGGQWLRGGGHTFYFSLSTCLPGT